jgi:DNA-binding transcriptional regulator GbsR (MarR family)
VKFIKFRIDKTYRIYYNILNTIIAGMEMPNNLRDEEKSYLEEVGVVFEQTGLPRMAGRVFGWLLISDPPYQSSAELVEVLMASKGSISTTTRFLIQMGLVERFIVPGVRHDYFRLKQDALRRTIRHGLEDEIKMFRQLAEKGLVLMGKEPSTRRQWLEEMRDRYIFLEQEFPALMERWEKQQLKNRVKLMSKNG